MTTHTPEFASKTILITGATSGIGRATALWFARAGANVVATGRSTQAGEDLMTALEPHDGEAAFLEMDVTDEPQVASVIETVVKQFGQIDFAFNNAGIFAREPDIHEHTSEVWDEVISTNLSSVYYCMKHEIAQMLAAPGDHQVIVNNASIIGHRGSSASGVAYTVAKHGVIGLTRQAAATYAGRGLRVNAVSPGPTLTAVTSHSLADQSESAKERLKTLNPTGQLVEVDHIAATVGFLCSEAARMINGDDIALDGGQLAKL